MSAGAERLEVVSGMRLFVRADRSLVMIMDEVNWSVNREEAKSAKTSGF